MPAHLTPSQLAEVLEQAHKYPRVPTIISGTYSPQDRSKRWDLSHVSASLDELAYLHWLKAIAECIFQEIKARLYPLHDEFEILSLTMNLLEDIVTRDWELDRKRLLRQLSPPQGLPHCDATDVFLRVALYTKLHPKRLAADQMMREAGYHLRGRFMRFPDERSKEESGWGF